VRKKTLVYGFRPFLDVEENISASVVRALRPRGGLVKRVFDVKFHRSQFIDAVRAADAELVLGLGLHGRARKLRIERRAVNVRRSPHKPCRPIRAGGPDYRFVSLKIRPSALSTVTYDAGTYVCNFSMYVLSEFCESRGIPYAFVHVPPDARVRDVVKFVDSVIR